MVTRPKHHAFTLVEMLVVMAMIGMLVSMLIPSMHRARLQARDTKCMAQLRSIYLAESVYLHDYGRFSELNNEPDDGAWQYNYLIFDGRDFDSNFGPLVVDGQSLETIETLFCPRQKDPYHSLATPQNPWPVVPLLDTRAAYCRRYHLSGRALSELHGNPAILADVFHIPRVVKSGHGNGINVAYLDGHVQWVPDRGFLSDNELTHPFQTEDNDLIEDIWDDLNKGGAR